MAKNKIVVVCGKEKFEVDVEDEQTITIWKIGDKASNWIPSRRHLDEFVHQLKKAIADPKNNHIVYHKFLSVEQVKI